MRVEYVCQLSQSNRWDIWYFYEGGASWTRGTWVVEDDMLLLYADVPPERGIIDRILGTKDLSHVDSSYPVNEFEILSANEHELKIREPNGITLVFRPHRGQRSEDIRAFVE